MADHPIEILSSAWRDIDRISAYCLDAVGSASAEHITDKLLDTIESLRQFPYMGALHPDPVLSRMEYRKLLCGEYICVYRVIGEKVFIYRVVHGATDYPKYFK